MTFKGAFFSSCVVAGAAAVSDPAAGASESVASMAKSIDRSLLVENISKAKNEIEIKEVANDFIFNISHSLENETGIASDLDTLAEATLFSDIYLLWSIRRSILEVFKYHLWFVAHRDDEKQLDRMLTKFVEDYNDPKVKW